MNIEIPSELATAFRRARVRLERVVRERKQHAESKHATGPSALELDKAVAEHARSGMAVARYIDDQLHKRTMHLLEVGRTRRLTSCEATAS
jgi:hypothetical protein